MELLTGFQIGILLGARSFQLRSGFSKHIGTGNLGGSQELKGQSEKFKNQYRSCS
jgi:hypothetical protein